MTNTSPPVVTDTYGSPTHDGDQLSTTAGGWMSCDSPINAYYYYWLRNGSVILSGSTSYAVVAPDITNTLQSEVEACNTDDICNEAVSNALVVYDRPPDTPYGLSPTDGSVFTSAPTLSSVFNDPDPGQTGYVSYSVYRDGTDSPVAAGSGPYVSEGSASAWSPGSLAPGDQYDWVAQAGDSTGESSSVTDWQYYEVPPSVALSSPANGASLTTATPVLSASGSSVSPIYYEFQVATDSGFSNVVADSGWLPTTSTWTVTPGALQDGHTYYWRARAADYYGTVSAWPNTANRFSVSLPKLGANSAWPMWSHGPLAVNEANGNLVLSLPTPSYPTPTGSLTFSFTYNSQATTSSAGLGAGWTLVAGDGSISPPLKLVDHSSAYNNPPTLAAAEIDWSDGSSDYFNQVGSSNTYFDGGGTGSQLTKDSDGTWTLSESDGTTYTFRIESSTGIALLSGAEAPATKAGNGILDYSFNSSGEITSLAFQDTTTSSPTETLSFVWGTSCDGVTALVCVTGPDNRIWAYTANSSNQITGVYDSLPRQLYALSYTNGVITKIQNANDLDPNDASPNYNGNHAIDVVYDSNSPARVACVIDGPDGGQSASPQPSCAGGGSAPESTWSFNYHPGTIEPTPPRASHYGYLVRDAAPAAYYPLDETSGTTTAIDASGNGNNATYSGSYTQGQPGALAGAGGGTSVAFGGGTVSGSTTGLDLSPGGYNTVEFWVNWNGSNGEMPFGFQDYDLFFYNGHFGFNTGCSNVYGTTAPTANTWHYVVAEFYNGDPVGNDKLWIDGVQQPMTLTGTDCSGTASANFAISGWPDDGGYRLGGSVDEAAIYGYPLNASQIAAHFAEGVHDPAPVAYYRLDEESGTTAPDSSGNGNDASYSGSYSFGGNPAYSGAGTSVSFSGGTVAGSIPNVNTTAGGYNTVEFWMKWDGGQGEIPFSFGEYALFFNWNDFGFWSASGGDYYGATPPSANVWHYVVAEFYNGRPEDGAKLWVDGVEQTLTEIGTPSAGTVGSTFNISGWSANDGWRMAGGSIDEVAVYNTALSPAEIASHYYTNHTVGWRDGAAAGYTTLTPPDQQGKSCPSDCSTTYYDSSGRAIENVDLLGHISEVGYNPAGETQWSEDAAGNPTDYLYGGPNGQPSGDSSVGGVLLQMIGPDPDRSGPLARPITMSRYDEETIGSPTSPGTPLTGLAGSYWSGSTPLAGQPSVRENDPAAGSSASSFSLPASGSWPVSGSSSARWSGDVLIPSAGDYTFATVSDGGTRLLVDGSDSIENWTIPSSSSYTSSSTAPIHLDAGLHQLVLEYEHAGSENASPAIALEWSCSDCGQPIKTLSAIPLINLLPAWLNETSTVSPAGRISFSHFADPALGEPDYTLVQPQAATDVFAALAAVGGQGGGGAGSCLAGAGGDGGTTSSGSDIAASYSGGSGGSGYVYCGIGADTGGGGGSSAGTAASGNNGQNGVYRTGGDVNLGGAAPTGGGAGGGSQWQPGDGGYPGGPPGGGGGASGAAATPSGCATYYTAGNGADGQVTITPNSGSPTTYSTAGMYTYTVASGVSSLTLQLWGAGGGGGRGYAVADGTATGGGGGGGGAYLESTTIPVASGETLSVGIGAGGAAGAIGGGSGYGCNNGAASPGAAGGDTTVTESAPPTNAPEQLITRYSYDSFGRTSQTWMPKGNANVTITADGALSGSSDNTYSTTDTYYGSGFGGSLPSTCGSATYPNEYEQLEQTQVNGEHAVNYVYDQAGNLVAKTNAAGTTCTTYSQNEERLQSVTVPGSPGPITTSYTYDPSGQQLEASGPTNNVVTYYDEQGRLVDTRDANRAEEHLGYDADGNITYRIANTHPLSGTSCPSSSDYCTTYSYNAADQLTSEIDPASNTYNFYYDDRGDLRGTQYPNGTFSWVDTNPDGLVSDQYNRHGTINAGTTTPPSDSSPLADFTYSYDPDGKRLSQTEISGSTNQTTNYQYDNLGRLDQVVLPDGTCRLYSYDDDSNRTQTQEAPTGCNGSFTTTASYTYDPNTTPGVDELTSINQAGNNTNYTYTGDGQVAAYGTTGLTWDGWGRLSTASAGSNTITYTYDPTGALMTRTSSSPATTINYLLGDLFETDASGTITTSYTDGPAGNLASFNGPPTGTPTYLYYDAHGNPVAEANPSGTLTAGHTYDPFGAPLDTPPSNTTVHRFVGRWDKQYDTSTSLILMGARPYDPTTGRFLSNDPIPGGSLNNYDYAGQDPINNYDLNGTALMDPMNFQVGFNPNAVECDITGCGVVRLDYSNSAVGGGTLLRLAIVGTATLGIVATGSLADEFVAAALEDADAESAGFRNMVNNLLHGDVSEKEDALQQLRVRLGAANGAAGRTLLNPDGQPSSLIRRAAIAWIRTLLRGWG